MSEQTPGAYRCEQCNISFNSQEEFQKHNNTVHVGTAWIIIFMHTNRYLSYFLLNLPISLIPDSNRLESSPTCLITTIVAMWNMWLQLLLRKIYDSYHPTNLQWSTSIFPNPFDLREYMVFLSISALGCVYDFIIFGSYIQKGHIDKLLSIS